MIWFLLATCVAIGVLVSAWRFGPRAPLGAGFLLTLLFPCWLHMPGLGLPFDLRLLGLCVGLIVYCFHRDAVFTVRLVPADYAMLALFGVNLASDWINDGFDFVAMLRAYVEWIVPYLAGRLAWASWTDTRRCLPWAVGVAVLMTGWAVTEALSYENPVNDFVGARPATRGPRIDLRLGMKRAEGPTSHPIWFAMVQTLLLPWTVSVAARYGKRVPGLWLLPVATAVGVFVTGARGPMFAVGAASVGFSAWCLPEWRRVILVIGGVSLALAVVQRGNIYEALHQWTGEVPKARRTIEVDGEDKELSALSSRWLIIKAYERSAFSAGLFGYGTQRTNSFPIQVPFGPEAHVNHKYLWSIDNAYLLITLRLGWFGLIAFATLFGCVVWQTAQLAWRSGNSHHDIWEFYFAAALCCTLLAITVLLSAEWVAYDFGCPLLWTLGGCSGLTTAMRTRQDRPTESNYPRGTGAALPPIAGGSATRPSNYRKPA